MLGSWSRTKAATQIKVLCFALLVVGVLASNARAQDGGGLVGSWYGELAISETRAGRDVDYRRWLRIVRPDGTFTIVFRYYLHNRLQLETIENGVWGHQGRLYWTECRFAITDGQSVSCSQRWEYDVHRIDSREMAYTSRATGQHYVMTRVPNDFRLP